MAERYTARSAGGTEDWPYWYVADRERTGLNVTVQLVPEMTGYMPFLPREDAERIARAANDAPPRSGL